MSLTLTLTLSMSMSMSMSMSLSLTWTLTSTLTLSMSMSMGILSLSLSLFLTALPSLPYHDSFMIWMGLGLLPQAANPSAPTPALGADATTVPTVVPVRGAVGCQPVLVEDVLVEAV